MNLQEVTVLPTTPKALRNLEELANNLFFSWTPGILRLFKRLDPASWEAAEHNPVRMLAIVPDEKLEAAANDVHFLSEMEAVYDRFSGYCSDTTWFQRRFSEIENPGIAYFSCEFGLHESVPVYSGGLGILAGDHMKSASDLGLPLVGIGLFYHQGYFRQSLSHEGDQLENYPNNDPTFMPVSLVRGEDGEPIIVEMPIDHATVSFQIWEVLVGRTKIYLLDTDLPVNAPRERGITARLYEGDRETRIRQEILLGIGGVRALAAMNVMPHVFHVNEGHSAFLLLERIRMHMQDDGLSYHEARTLVWSTTVFTTHTPVPAGNERFDPKLVHKYLASYTGDLGLEWHEFLALGRERPDDDSEEFCMTVLALKLSAFANGVAKLHGCISRNMWQNVFPGIPESEVPIGSITNGVHGRTWLNPQLRNLFLRYLGPTSVNELADFTMFKGCVNIPDEDLWEVHKFKRHKLIRFARERVREQLLRRGADGAQVASADNLLNPDALTIGFARRFATYKRGNLWLSDPERLHRILSNTDRPVQIIIAGKAHPADGGGKGIMKHVFSYAKNPEFVGKIVLLEDYDIEVGRRMVQGVDVWLNTPERPKEASGTSGMKAALNGGLNLSILDGWWDEAYTPDVGFAIGHGQNMGDHGYNPDTDAELLYSLLERVVVPMYYTRDEKQIPRRWVAMMKSSISELGGYFNCHRMVAEYTNNYYIKAEKAHAELTAEGYAGIRGLSSWLQGLDSKWQDLEIVEASSPSGDSLRRGSKLQVEAKVRLGSFDAENVCCEVYHGPLEGGELQNAERVAMQAAGTVDGITTFEASIDCQRGGRYAYTVRALPGHPNLPVNVLPNMVKWA
jgi:glycogen phosphorylase